MTKKHCLRNSDKKNKQSKSKDKNLRVYLVEDTTYAEFSVVIEMRRGDLVPRRRVGRIVDRQFQVQSNRNFAVVYPDTVSTVLDVLRLPVVSVDRRECLDLVDLSIRSKKKTKKIINETKNQNKNDNEKKHMK